VTTAGHDGGDSGAAGNGAAGTTAGDAGNLDGAIYFVTDASADHASGDASDRGQVPDVGSEVGADAPTDLAKESTPDVPAEAPADAPADAPPAAVDGSGVAGDALVACTWVGDFDGDGISDCARLAQSDGQKGDIIFRKGIGSGTFATTTVTSAGIVPITVPQNRFTMAIVDLNHDGRQDILTGRIAWIDANHNPPLLDEYALMFWGQADGTFASSSSGDGYKFTGTNLGISIGGPLEKDYWIDWDGDGLIELPGLAGGTNEPKEWVVFSSASGTDLHVAETPQGNLGGLNHQFVIPSGAGKALVSLGWPGPRATCTVQTWTLGLFLSSGGKNGFNTLKIEDSEYAESVQAKDLDGDNLPDLITTFKAGVDTCGTRCRAPRVAFLSTLNYKFPPLTTFDPASDHADFAGDSLADDVSICGAGDASVHISGQNGNITLPNTAGALRYRFLQPNPSAKADLELTFIDGKKVFHWDGAGFTTPP
jgi:hypothetical protein